MRPITTESGTNAPFLHEGLGLKAQFRTRLDGGPEHVSRRDLWNARSVSQIRTNKCLWPDPGSPSRINLIKTRSSL